MATPTEGEIQTQLANVVKYLDECHLFATTNTPNLIGMEDTIAQSLESDYGDLTLANLTAMRQSFASIIANAAGLMAPGLLTYAKLMGFPESNIQLIIDRLYQRFVDNSLSVNSRAFTFGSPSAGVGNVGDGVILRLNTDENSFPIESQTVDAKQAKCVLDAQSGADVHEEVFEFTDGWAGRDILEREDGGGALDRIRALSARDSLLLNPSFSEYSGTIALPTAITNWTSSTAVIGDGTDYTIDQTNTYRDFQGDTTPSSLNIKLTRNLTQRLSVRGTQLDPNVPYMLQVAWNRAIGGATGTLLIRMGAVNNSVAVAAQAGWNLLRVVASPNQNCWLANFNEANLDIAIEWTRTAGELLIDDVLFVPATGFDGSWYWLLGGQTKWRIDDIFTWTDTATESKIQRWFWRAFRRYLPSNNAGAETWADPA